VVVIDAGLNIVVVKLFIVPFTELIFVHEIFPDVMVVSIPILADDSAVPAIGT
tara:strand:+ start:148 stop:306 length:159 start_codon:yes stop_codon:yes gene_type:complete